MRLYSGSGTKKKKKNQRENQEACGLKLVLENGLQIEIGSSGTADLHACVTPAWNRGTVQARKEFCYSRGALFPFFFSIQWRFQNGAIAVFILVHSWLSRSLLFQGQLQTAATVEPGWYECITHIRSGDIQSWRIPQHVSLQLMECFPQVCNS